MADKSGNTIVVVSGLPRSGTSMMMAMLAAGGMPVVRDDTRPPDVHNPRGYWESSQVPHLARDATWLANARGHAVKIISFHLFALPTGFEYRVLFMARPLTDIVASQNQMLGTPGNADGAASQLTALYEKHLAHVGEWLQRQPHIRTLRIVYPHAIAAPDDTAAQVAGFLGTRLDIAAMAAAVVPSLNRHSS